MEKISNIVFIGAGNVATNLAHELKSKGLNILQIYSRTLNSAEKLASAINAKFTVKEEEILQTADLYIVSVNDDIILDVLKNINLKNKKIVHTSGSVDINIFSNITDNYGVFYPLQTFSKEEIISFKEIPFCIEANNLSFQNQLIELANIISEKVQILNSEERRVLHIAAVFACNFTGYMYLISNDILNENKISFDILKPLIQRTAEKVKKIEPIEAITGPAKRNDIEVIKKHLIYLEKFPEFKKIYKDLSDSIIEYFNNKNNTNVKL